MAARSICWQVLHRVGGALAAAMTVRAVQQHLLAASPERAVELHFLPAAAAVPCARDIDETSAVGRRESRNQDSIAADL